MPPEEEPDVSSPADFRNPGLPLGVGAMPVLVAGFDRNQNPFAVCARLDFFFTLISAGATGLISNGPTS